jgi:hypothetical protein
MDLEIGSKVTTSTGRKGTIAHQPFHMPCHYFIEFNDGSRFFIVKTAVQLLIQTHRSKPFTEPIQQFQNSIGTFNGDSATLPNAANKLPVQA